MIMRDKPGTIRASFEIADTDLAGVLRLAMRDGVMSGVIYRRAVAEYLVNHAPAEWWENGWPVGDGITSQDHGSAPTVSRHDPAYDRGFADGRDSGYHEGHEAGRESARWAATHPDD